MCAYAWMGMSLQFYRVMKSFGFKYGSCLLRFLHVVPAFQGPGLK